MRNYWLIAVVLQLSLAAIAVSQITFTREWVTGKRSFPTGQQVVSFPDERAWCSRSLIPAIDLLSEIESMRKSECGGYRLKNPGSWIHSPMDEIAKAVITEKEGERFDGTLHRKA